MTSIARPVNKKAILLDVNQTLVEQGRSFEQCFKSVWGDYTARWLQEESPTKEDVWQAYIRRWHLRRKTNLSSQRLDELEQACFLEAIAELDIPLPSSMVRSMLVEARTMQSSAKRPAPHVIPMLHRLASSYKLAIISNSPRTEVLGLLEKFDLIPFFQQERIFTAGKPSEKKPSPYLFKAALKKLEVSPRHALMVGNSWKHDICGATKVGIDAVWYHPPKDPSVRSPAKTISHQKLGKRSVYCIVQLDQLPELLL
ncbi:HAD family hydrolase [Paenibacillus silviterrae]|uniref:HAD family hydrolase n=1 Tax=Paenibacillus silviterrae TaxID=3242194 RepID=UPI002543BDFA|nr:HAD family hydrolase [Paenibacillus chinjuensis]